MPPTEKSPEMLEEIIEGLLGQQATRVGDEEIVIDVELAVVAKSLSIGMDSGPNGVPNLTLKVAIAEAPEMIRSAMQKCLDEGVFPEVWKRQSLVILPKAGKPPGDPSAYRPICLIDTAGKARGKVLNMIILNRMLRHTEGVNGLSSSQYSGFRKGRSTVDAILSVTKTTENALEHKRRRRICYCASSDSGCKDRV